MIEQEVMWTALPNGISGGRMRLSVFVSPRLKTDQNAPGKTHPALVQFPDFLNWPAHGFDFVARFDGGASVPATRVSAAPQPELWQALFDAETYIKSYEFPKLDERIVRSYPVKHVLGFLKDHYQRTAVESPTQFAPVQQFMQPENSLMQIGLFEELQVTAPGPQIRPGAAGLLRQQADITRGAPLRRQPGVTGGGPLGGAAVGGGGDTAGPGTARPLANIASAVPIRRAVSASAVLPQGELAQVMAQRQERETQLTQELTQRLTRLRAIPATPTPDPARDFLQVKLFHRALNARAIGNPRERRRAVIQVPRIDFHEMVSTLGDYPELMRRLGIVVDLEITPPPGLPASTRVWVEPTWQQAPTVTTKNVTPKTKCLTQDGFVAQPKGSEILGRMLRLHDPGMPPEAQPYDVVQVDVDGAAAKAMEHTHTVMRRVVMQRQSAAPMRTTSAPAADTTSAPTLRLRPQLLSRPALAALRVPPLLRAADDPETTSLPAMRSGGISLVKHGRAIQLVAMLRTARVQSDAVTANPSADITLYAEDITRGYRADVYDGDSGKWRTLCARAGRYDFRDGGARLDIQDEGWISQASTEAADGSSQDLHVPETLFRWAGWSLVAPRPGKTVGLDDRPADFVNTPDTEFGLAVNFRAAAGSLPRLRFGPQYRLRARCVDLAGNGLTLGEADALMSGVLGQRCASELFQYERFEPVPSPVTALRQSIKGSPGESLERLVIRSFNDTPAKDAQRSTESTERHLAAPLGPQLLAEHHGMFDTPGGLDPGAYNTIVQREGTLLVGTDPAQEQTHPEAQLSIPYLPDPLARGAALFGLPGGTPLQPTRVEFAGGWPDVKPFRIQIVEGNAPPQWDPGPRVLTVGIAKAEMVSVRLSSYLNEDDVRLMGLWGWMNASGESSTTKGSLLRLSAEGRHWMIAPFRELVLVHAVQQPLIIPAFKTLVAGKAIGRTVATIRDEFPISGKSTAKADILAEWQEPIDALSEPEWQSIPGKTHVCEIPVEPDDEALSIRHPHEFGDTKYRQVTYTAVATTRFREYLPFTDEQIESGQRVITRTSQPETVDVLSSARPESPKVVYVVPTFGWTQDDTAQGKTSTRSGGGLRIYMERPWFSSGDGEQLGVVLPQSAVGGGLSAAARAVAAAPRIVASRAAASRSGISRAPAARPGASLAPAAQVLAPMIAAPTAEQLKPYITQWGADPLWATTATSDSPSSQAFRRAAGVEQDLTLDELTGAKIAVIGHEVGYDRSRRLWYCDIEIDPGTSYYPFVRLALVRYQPNSVKTTATDCKLSRVVLADFAQLSPDRAAAVAFAGGDARTISVSLTGVVYSGSGAGGGSSTVEVSVEKRRPGVEGDLGWIPVPGSVVPLDARRLNDTRVLWNGTLTLPGDRGSEPFRLIFKEYETFLADERVSTSTAATGPTGRPTASIVGPRRTQRRLVYADAMEI
jgi:hypothetical protein